MNSRIDVWFAGALVLNKCAAADTRPGQRIFAAVGLPEKRFPASGLRRKEYCRYPV